MKRREFLTTSLAASAFVSLSCASSRQQHARGAIPAGKRDLYEMRVYRLKSAADAGMLDRYLENASIPALNGLGAKPVGVFKEIEPKETPLVFVLITYPSMDVFGRVIAGLNTDPMYLQRASEYLQRLKTNPVFDRVDSWFMLAFAGIPRIELPAYSIEKRPRIFEIRTYESYSESKALKKVDMFNDGEIEVMREVKLAPVFFGQSLIGSDLPHLTYMLSAENQEAHKEHWGVFGKHPTWDKMKNDPQYADTVSKIRNWFVKPTPYSQI